MEQAEMIERIRQKAFFKNNGMVLKAVNLLRDKLRKGGPGHVRPGQGFQTPSPGFSCDHAHDLTSFWSAGRARIASPGAAYPLLVLLIIIKPCILVKYRGALHARRLCATIRVSHRRRAFCGAFWTKGEYFYERSNER